MGEVSTIGLDLAKEVFQVHGADAAGATIIGKVGCLTCSANRSDEAPGGC
jgi:hypothetical protein